jgi:hypothetical protein
MASTTSSKMEDCDWLKSTFSGPLFSRNGAALHYAKIKRMYFKTKLHNKFSI